METEVKNKPMKKIAVIDIDGTLSVVGNRRRYIESEPKDWDRFYADSFDDTPIDDMCDFVRWLAKSYEIIFCTSRRESVRDKTQVWLQRYLFLSPPEYTLIMRSNADKRPDVISKIDSFTKETTEAERANVAFVIEDSAAMAAMWRGFGYRCFHASTKN